MLRATLATLLLAFTAAAFVPPASAANECEAIFAYNPLDNQTIGAACAPVDAYFCYHGFIPSLPGCARAAVNREVAYVMCYGTTGPLYWVPDCT